MLGNKGTVVLFYLIAAVALGFGAASVVSSQSLPANIVGFMGRVGLGPSETQYEEPRELDSPSSISYHVVQYAA